MIRHVLSFISVFLISSSAHATEKSASDTARDFFDLLEHQNYSAVATYYSPAALRQFRQLMSFEELTDEQMTPLADSSYPDHSRSQDRRT